MILDRVTANKQRNDGQFMIRPCQLSSRPTACRSAGSPDPVFIDVNVPTMELI